MIYDKKKKVSLVITNKIHTFAHNYSLKNNHNMEELMYYVWQQRMFQSIQTIDETEIEIIHPGLRNLDAGPDFFNAKIRIDGTLWAGNVEMHVKSSDWFRHHHHDDRSYDSVILHVVLQADAEIKLHDGEIVKTAVMKIPNEVMEKFQSLTSKNTLSFSAINCKNELSTIPSIILHDWQTSLAIQRMLNKAKKVKDIIEDKQKSWPEAFYVMFARALGTGINSDACERLARSLPYAFLQKHFDNQMQVEALLLGQAGLIEDPALKAEYDFLCAKYNLQPIQKVAWKLARIRPQASPVIRLKALAWLLCNHHNLLSDIMDCKDIDALTKLLTVPNLLGIATTCSLIINSVIPILLAYAQWQVDNDLCEKAMNLLDSLPAESNRFMDYWIECGIPLRNALDSQAMLQLYKEYCEPHKCMRCRLGCWLIKQKKK